MDAPMLNTILNAVQLIALAWIARCSQPPQSRPPTGPPAMEREEVPPMQRKGAE